MNVTGDNWLLWIASLIVVGVVVSAITFSTPRIINWLWGSKSSISAKARSFIEWADHRWYYWFYCFPLFYKANKRNRDHATSAVAYARDEVKIQLFLRIRDMLDDARDQRYGSFVELEDGVKRDKIGREIETVAMGRIEALKDILSYLDPDAHPPEEWDSDSFKNTTAPGTVVIQVGDPIRWELHNNDTHTPKRWIYVERLEKKWGRKHRYYFRPNLERRDGTL